MGLNAKKVGGGNGGGNRVPQANIEPGTYPARLVQIIDLGLQAQRPYQGKDKPPAQEIMLTYELVDTFMLDEDGNELEDKPRWISETLPFYGLYADKAKSTQRYNAIDPTGEYDGDFAKAIGTPINVTIVNNAVGDKVYDNIATISAMRPRDADKCPELVNPSKLFDLDNPDMEVFNALPEWLRDKIKSNLNFKGSPLEDAVGNAPAPAKEKAKKAESKKPEPAAADEGDGDNNPF
jgi:hypothetical protein